MLRHPHHTDLELEPITETPLYHDDLINKGHPTKDSSSKRLLSTTTKRLRIRRAAMKQADAEAFKDWLWISAAALLSFACLVWGVVWMLGTSTASQLLGSSSAGAWKSFIQGNPIYQAADSHPLVGDRSFRYAFFFCETT